jgi:hypothetical protein
MDFGLSSNPVYGTYPSECSLSVITCHSISAVVSHVPWVVPLLLAIVGNGATLVRARQFCRDRIFERLRMGSKRKDLFYYLVSSHINNFLDTFLRLTESDDRAATNFLRMSAQLKPNLSRMGS